jgi:hypothetical protein
MKFHVWRSNEHMGNGELVEAWNFVDAAERLAEIDWDGDPWDGAVVYTVRTLDTGEAQEIEVSVTTAPVFDGVKLPRDTTTDAEGTR